MIFLVLITSGVSAFLILKQIDSDKALKTPSPLPSNQEVFMRGPQPSMEEKELEEAKNMEKDLEGWRVYKDEGCNVIFHVPPIEEPYYHPYDPDREPGNIGDPNEGTGSYWDIPRGGSKSAFMHVIGAENEYNHVPTTYTFLGCASGACGSDGAVSVRCTKNTYEVADLSEFIIGKANSYSGGLPQGPDKVINVNVREIEKWGMNVLEVSWDDYFGTFSNRRTSYVFQKDGLIYEVSSWPPAEYVAKFGLDDFYKRTVDEIVQKLEFF